MEIGRYWQSNVKGETC